MVSFISKKINEEENEENLGKLLREARGKKGLSIETASNLTGINVKYLIAFEENDFGKLPEGIYADKFLKTYADFLSLGKKNILLFPIIKTSSHNKELRQLRFEHESRWKKIKRFILSPLFIKNTLLFIITIFGISYLYSIGYAITKPPKLDIFEPNNDIVINNYQIKIKGETEKEAKIFINNREIFCSQNGDFSETLDLKKGVNIVKISAQKKYGKDSVVYRKILVEESQGEEAVTVK
ncbi:MAG: helix-turn-helix domain-containing protein [bacterium]